VVLEQVQFIKVLSCQLKLYTKLLTKFIHPETTHMRYF